MRLTQRLDDLASRAETAIASRFRQKQRLIADLTAAVLRHDPRQQLARARERLQACRTHLDRSQEHQLHTHRARLSALDARLHSLSPLAVLERGYALVLNAEGKVIRSTAQVTTGDKLLTRLADGAFVSRVESAAPGKPHQ